MFFFQLNRIKFYLSLNRKTSQKGTETVLAVCSISAGSFFQVGSRINFEHHPDAKYIRKQKCRMLLSKNIHKNIQPRSEFGFQLLLEIIFRGFHVLYLKVTKTEAIWPFSLRCLQPMSIAKQSRF